uniref:receptor-transporting protein 3-like n=1 Tax=Scatophagus argus TaxID=75038 RepID=UPI001ED815C1|nr:receptor-transporting protein 3-like [Scatophagus argus]
MELQEWTRIFKMKAMNLQQDHSWHLEFDESLVPDSPNSGWQQYIRNTSARFRCSACGRSWPSNRVMVVFHMRLTYGQGTVKVRRFRQNCKNCQAAPMENPSISSDNINILMENLVKKIRIKCYHEQLEKADRPFVNLDVKSPHEPAHCEACMAGICTRS